MRSVPACIHSMVAGPNRFQNASARPDLALWVT